MPTQLAQMGSVAKTQSQTQQAAQPATNFQEQQAKEDSLKVQRVQESEKAAKNKVDPDADRRRERRRKRQQKRTLAKLEEGNFDNLLEKTPEGEEEEVGLLVDLRA